MSKEDRRTTARATISIPRDLKAKADERARALNRNFSNYVTWLIEQDSRDEALPPHGLKSKKPINVTN